jgi:hypothetical protein
MIKICFAPGTYGTYLARCVYYYSNLNQHSLKKFDFDQHGSSHAFRSNSVIQIDHVENNITFGLDDSTVVILPCRRQRLDYFNNAFMKYYHGDLMANLRDTFGSTGINEIDHKLRERWNHTGGFNHHTPRWIVREFCSMWISVLFDKTFPEEKYQLVPNKLCISADDILTDHQNTLLKIFDVLDLQLMASESEINHNHQNFLQAQKYIGSQHRCDDWCNDTLEGVESATPCQTMFDEVYVQDQLRARGFEIRCDGLDMFPSTSTELKKIIYKQ